jgi:hypothetical protein
MAIEGHVESIDAACERLHQTRAQFVALAHEWRDGPPRSADTFPRSAIMRAATGRNGRMLLSGAALSLAVMRPGLLPLIGRLTRLAPWVPLLSGVVNRYLVRRNIH